MTSLEKEERIMRQICALIRKKNNELFTNSKRTKDPVQITPEFLKTDGRINNKWSNELLDLDSEYSNDPMDFPFDKED